LKKFLVSLDLGMKYLILLARRGDQRRCRARIVSATESFKYNTGTMASELLGTRVFGYILRSGMLNGDWNLRRSGAPSLAPLSSRMSRDK